MKFEDYQLSSFVETNYNLIDSTYQHTKINLQDIEKLFPKADFCSYMIATCFLKKKLARIKGIQ